MMIKTSKVGNSFKFEFHSENGEHYTSNLVKRNKLSSLNTHFYLCTFAIPKSGANADDVLSFIKQSKTAVTEHLQNLHNTDLVDWNKKDSPESEDCKPEYSVHVNMVLTRKIHKVVREGTFQQKITYISLVGQRDEICRQSEFTQVVMFLKVQDILTQLGITNHFNTDVKSRRIQTIHPMYLMHDEEVREGLRVTQHNHPNDNTMFVESEETLALALKSCEKGSTLVLYGHWVHGSRSIFGVWKQDTAKPIAYRISNLINMFPGKISHINLLGCETGSLRDDIEKNVRTDGLYFKYDEQPEKLGRPMGNLRNRATYVSERNGDTVFHPDSLAGKLLPLLDDTSIAVTATSRACFPYPVDNPKYIISSEAKQWKEEHNPLTDAPITLYEMLRETKSITQVSSNSVPEHSKSPWGRRKVSI